MCNAKRQCQHGICVLCSWSVCIDLHEDFLIYTHYSLPLLGLSWLEQIDTVKGIWVFKVIFCQPQMLYSYWWCVYWKMGSQNNIYLPEKFNVITCLCRGCHTTLDWIYTTTMGWRLSWWHTISNAGSTLFIQLSSFRHF